MAAKKAVKKVATKKVTKRVSAPKPRMVSASDPFYVVMQRGFLGSKFVGLYTAREDASNKATALDAASNSLYNRYVVERVDLVS